LTGPAALLLATPLPWQAALHAGQARQARRPAPPPAMTFTRNVRADVMEGRHTGQNEPVVTVDQSGLTFVSWQGADRPGNHGATNTVATRDGRHFRELGATDPAGQGGDVTMATTSWPSRSRDLPAGGKGENGVFWGDLGSSTCGPLGFRAAFSGSQGRSWSARDAGCQPFQVDRDWIAAYTPPRWRGTREALKHTVVYDAYHDFGPSNVWVSRSTNGGASWTTVQQSAIQPGSAGQLTSACNTYPGGVAVDQYGRYKGRVYVVWDTGDPAQNAGEGCNITSAAPFDHVFVSYSDNEGRTWTTHTVFNDPCAPSPPEPPVHPGSCQDTSEGWTPIAVDAAGNVYVAFTWIDIRARHPDYDVYLEYSTDGGATWNHGKLGGALGYGDAPGAPVDVSARTHGTNYYPTIAAAGNGAVDIAWYHTNYVTRVGTLEKPATQPGSAVWNVYLAQSLDVLHGQPFTVSRVTSQPIYFGDICTIGIACGTPIPGTDWAVDRTLFDNFGMAVGPDGGARLAWTDAHDSWTSRGPHRCEPGGRTDSNVGCQTTHVFFACQTSGLGLNGDRIVGCGRAAPRRRR
jgi:hypothetical protein